ncbi:hypothetical protein DFH27DRAFT_292218 [Peziza echinospora]|nr:hypothetical protein DFH27DRAFT_292218 [Peziza echinospora]
MEPSNYTSGQSQQHERGVKRPYPSSPTNSSPIAAASSHGAALSTMSRAAVSYPRKRAIAACQVCRGRKTKCDNERPTCGFCRQAGAICVYEGDKQATFDAASLAILDGIAKIQSRLDLLSVPQTPTHGQPPTPTPSPFVATGGPDATTAGGNGVSGITTHLSHLPPIQQFPLPQFNKPTHMLPQQSLPLTPPIHNPHAQSSAGSMPQQPSHLSQVHTDGPHRTQTSAHNPLPPALHADRRVKLTTVGTTIEAVLQWPIFGGNYDADIILAPVFEDDDSYEEDSIQGIDTLDRGRWGNKSIVVDEKELEKYDITHLIDRFLTNVQTKNPILDQGILEEYADEIDEHGFDSSGKSCIVLIVCALGAISAPYSEAFPNSPKSSQIYPDLRVGRLFFEAAKKRFGTATVRNKLTTVQCFFLAGIYCMYTMQQFAAWKMFNAASVSCQAYLLKRRTWRGLSSASGAGGGRKLRKGEDGGVLSEETQNFEKRVYWSCLKSEMEICVELGTYPSGLSELRYPHAFPSPPRHSRSPQMQEATLGGNNGEGAYPLSSVLNASTSPTQFHNQSPVTPATTISSRPYYHTGSTTKNPQEDEITWFYYLAEIALRKIERKVNEAIHPSPDAKQLMKEFETEYYDDDDDDDHDEETNITPRRGSIGGSYSLQAARPRPPRTPTLLELEDLISMAEEFEAQMGIWYSYLPKPVKFNDLDPTPCQDERLQYLRGRSWKGKSDLYRPFAYYLIHHGELIQTSPKVYSRVAEFARKALTYDMLFTLTNVLEHRHHGAWLTLRGVGSGALVYLAAKKSGMFPGRLLPDQWERALAETKIILRYWGERMGARDAVPLLQMICKVEEDWFGNIKQERQDIGGGLMGNSYSM